MITFPITPLARNQFEAARRKLADAGTVLTGDEGNLEAHQVGIHFAYNGTDTLTITMEHKPWIIPASTVEEKIREWFTENGPALNT